MNFSNVSTYINEAGEPRLMAMPRDATQLFAMPHNSSTWNWDSHPIKHQFSRRLSCYGTR